MKKLILYALVLIALASCDRDKIGPQNLQPAVEPALQGKQVLILNEGNFQRGNASISAYDPESMEVQNNIFSNFNNGLPLGDVAQDMLSHEGRYYVSLNGSGSIQVLDSISWQAIAEIPINGTPTYLLIAGETLFVSDLFKRKIWRVNLDQLSVSNSISTPGPASHLIYWQNKLVAIARNQLLIINPESGNVESRQTLAGAGGRMVIDFQNRLWLLTTGSRNQRNLCALKSPSDTLTTYALGNLLPANSAKFLSINGNGRTLFMSYENQILCQSLTDSVPKLQNVFSLNAQSLYGMNVDPITGNIYLSDALDFDQAAEIYRYDSTGALLHRFQAGRISNGFYF